MRKHPAQSEWRALRRVAVSGREDEVRRVLLRLQQVYPEDSEVTDELARLEAGRPLRIAESKRQRAERLSQEAQRGILAILAQYGSAQAVSCAHTPDLRKAQQQLNAYVHTLKSGREAAPAGTRAFARALKSELNKRRKKNTRGRFIRLGIVAAVVAAVAAVGVILHGRAGRLSHQLLDAKNARDWNKTTELLRAADTGINRMMHREVIPAVEEARKWQQRVQVDSRELTRQMHVYENLGAVSSLSLEERAAFLRQIRALPAPFSTHLLEKWQELCRPVQQELERQKREAVARFSQPAPLPQLTEDPAQDRSALSSLEHKLSRLLHDFRDAQETFELDPKLIAAHCDTYAQAQRLLGDIDLLTRAENLLSTARNYTEYRNALVGFRPVSYQPALRAAETMNALGSHEETLLAKIRSVKHRVPAEFPAPYPRHVMNAITQAGPTFGPQFPASAAQLEIMEDLFTNRAMRTKLYELIAADGQVHYTEQNPEMVDGNKLRLRVSEFDPLYKLDERQKEWLYPQAVKMKLVDVSPLMTALQIDRSTFFSQANVPDLLGRITQVHAEACPALAKAYVYDTLLTLIAGQEQEPVLGLRFSPALRADMDSFRKLKAELGVRPRINLWLEHTSDQARAESAFARWFSQHEDRRYTREMSRNLRAILADRARYVGYADASCRVHYKELHAPAKGRVLYYISRGKLAVVPSSEELRDPDPFSPILAD